MFRPIEWYTTDAAAGLRPWRWRGWVGDQLIIVSVYSD